MNIDKVNYNISNLTAKNSQFKRPFEARRQVGFTGGVSQPVIKKAVGNLMPWVIKGMEKLQASMGEAQNIIINALGTGFIAPVFIKWNPLSKTDEDTRTYSAWRQPVSAVLAVITQLGVTIPFNKVISNMANSGEYGLRYDKKAKQSAVLLSSNKTPIKDASYIKKIIKKQHPNLSIEQINVKVDKEMAKQSAALLSSIKDRNTIGFNLNLNGKTTMQEIHPEEFKKLLDKTIDEMIKTESKELTKCNETKLPKRIDRSEYYRNNPQTSRELLEKIDTKLRSTTNVGEAKKYLRSTIKDLKKQKAGAELINLVKELKGLGVLVGDGFFSSIMKKLGKETPQEMHTAILEEMQGKISRNLEYVDKYSKMTSLKEVELEVNESVKSRALAITENNKFLESVKKAIAENKTVSQIDEMFKAEIKKVADSRINGIAFSDKVISKFKSIISSNVDGQKQIAGLIVSLAILPVTCSLLNWVYPRFMDAVFPNLSSKKHGNESKNLIERANKNSEVKS